MIIIFILFFFFYHHYSRTCWALRNYATKYQFKEFIIDNKNNNSGNITKNLDYSSWTNSTTCYYIVHIYKIRIADNSSLIVDPLGTWNPGSVMLKHPVSH